MAIADTIGRLTSLMSPVGKFLLLLNLPPIFFGQVTISWLVIIVLAGALEKLDRYNESFLQQVLMPGSGSPQPSVLRTHPHTEDRVERLRELKAQAPEVFDQVAEESVAIPVRRERDEVTREPKRRPLGLWF